MKIDIEKLHKEYLNILRSCREKAINKFQAKFCLTMLFWKKDVLKAMSDELKNLNLNKTIKNNIESDINFKKT